MNDFATKPLYESMKNSYHLVYFEDRGEWFIRCTERRGGAQSWSQEGYDSPKAAALAFDGCIITYTAEVPGQS